MSLQTSNIGAINGVQGPYSDKIQNKSVEYRKQPENDCSSMTKNAHENYCQDIPASVLMHYLYRYLYPCGELCNFQ